MRTEHIGPDDILVATKLQFTGDLTMTELAAIINAIEASIRAVVPEATRIFIEPDIHRAEF
jgi:divalent metal cation (Fe/Co/Zn/Cd) transporter